MEALLGEIASVATDWRDQPEETSTAVRLLAEQMSVVGDSAADAEVRDSILNNSQAYMDLSDALAAAEPGEIARAVRGTQSPYGQYRVACRPT